MNYKQLDRKASDIITKLRNKVAKDGYYENLGVTEELKFRDELSSSSLDYTEQWQLRDMLRQAIETI